MSSLTALGLRRQWDLCTMSKAWQRTRYLHSALRHNCCCGRRTHTATLFPCHQAPEAPVHAEGYLWKRGGNNTEWKRRWFVYEMGVLSWYKSDVDTEAKNSIAIESMTRCMESPEESAKNPKYRHCFEVSPLPGWRCPLCSLRTRLSGS